MRAVGESAGRDSVHEHGSHLVSADQSYDQSINSRVMGSEGRFFVGCSTGDGQVAVRIPCVSPKPIRSKRFLLQIFAKVMVETTRHDQDSRCSGPSAHLSVCLQRHGVWPRI